MESSATKQAKEKTTTPSALTSAARHSVELIDHYHHQFALAGDRAGQHHALLMALTLFDRARWTNKLQEADVFREWLQQCLNEPATEGPPAAPMPRNSPINAK